MGVLSARGWEKRQLLGWGEPAARWLINLGILVFIGLEIASDNNKGAIVMGIGVLLGVVTLSYRMWSTSDEPGLSAEAAGD